MNKTDIINNWEEMVANSHLDMLQFLVLEIERGRLTLEESLKFLDKGGKNG